MASVLPPQLTWLVPFLQFVPPIDILSTADFCGQDPPDNPHLDAADMISLVTGGRLGVGMVAAQKVQQAVTAFVWYVLCQCSSSATPAPPPGQVAPPDLPALNPPGFVSRPQVPPCKTVNGVPAGIEGTLDYNSVNSLLLPVGATSVRYTCTEVSFPLHSSTPGPPGCRSRMKVSQIGADNTVLSVTEPPFGLLPVGGSQQWTLTLLPGVIICGVELISQNEAGHSEVKIDSEAFCDGTVPGATVQPCCPPDAELWGMLQQLQGAVTLVQRQAAPFGYVPGAVHAGLTGSGEFAVADLLGVKVDVTTMPAYIGRRFGTPDRFFDVGRVSLGTADGWSPAQQLGADPTLVFGPVTGLYTRVGYTLQPNVVVTITELLREP